METFATQALSQSSPEGGAGSSQVQQLHSQLQQRTGQVQKLNADLEYTQEELQDLQRHCRSLEVITLHMLLVCWRCRRTPDSMKGCGEGLLVWTLVCVPVPVPFLCAWLPLVLGLQPPG